MFVNRFHFKAFSLVLVEYYCLLVIKSQTYSYLLEKLYLSSNIGGEV